MERIMLKNDAAECSACGACFTVCPKQAIKMVTNSEGCNYPKIDEKTCIQCGKCMQVCGYAESGEGKIPQKAYAALGQCDALVENSASGGIFASLAKNCINEGGMVAGAVLECNNNGVQVYHILSDRIEDIYRMQGSKYVQSDAWRCYGDIVRAVRAGKNVLFSGTPCQVAAVKRLTGDPDNLVTIDLICHGVPPVQMLDSYVKILAKRFRGNIDGLVFRDKSCQKSFCARVDVQRGRKKHSYFLRSHYLSFYKYFLEGTTYRENCYTCPYARLERISDITIGDYWGIEKYHSKDISAGRMPERADWSCVLVNTDKGQQFLDKHEGALNLFSTRVDWIAETNRQLNAPSKKTKERERVMECYADGGYAAVEAVFIHESGDAFRYYWRVLKNLYRNNKLHNMNKKQQT